MKNVLLLLIAAALLGGGAVAYKYLELGKKAEPEPKSSEKEKPDNKDSNNDKDPNKTTKGGDDKKPTKTTNGGDDKKPTKGGNEESSVELLEVPKKDWPMYGGHLKRNFVNPYIKNLPTEWDVDKGTNIIWTEQLGSRAYGGPVIADGVIIVGTNNEVPRNPEIKGDKGVVMAFSEKDGTFLWQIVHDKLKAGRVWDWPQQGVCSTPVIKDGKFYYVSNQCKVVCADLKTGKVEWDVDMIKDLKVFPHNIATCSPLILGDYLYLVTSNGVDAAHLEIPKKEAPSFLVLDITKKGEVVWSSDAPGPKIMHGQWSNPVYAEPNGKPQMIFPGGDGWIYAFEPKTGKLLWKFDCNPKGAVYELGGRGTANDFIATPVVYDNKLYIGVGQDPEHDTGVGHLWCIDITKTPTREDKDLSPELVVEPATEKGGKPKTKENPDSAKVWHYGGFVPEGKEAPTGESYYFGRSMSTCVVIDDILYTADLGGFVYCFNAKTGDLYWVHETLALTWSSPTYADGKIYIGNDDGNMLVFKHGKEKELLAEFSMGGTAKIRATPVATNGQLYVLTENPTKLWVIGKK